MSKSFKERLHALMNPKSDPKPQGVKRLLPDGTVLWADDKETLDAAYEALKDKHPAKEAK